MAAEENNRYTLTIVPWLRRPGHYLLVHNWLAITIARWIFAWRPLDDAELAHELTHARQWHDYGFVGYIVAYMREWARVQKAGKDRYRDNRFEVEARAAEDAVRRGGTGVDSGHERIVHRLHA